MVFVVKTFDNQERVGAMLGAVLFVVRIYTVPHFYVINLEALQNTFKNFLSFRSRNDILLVTYDKNAEQFQIYM